MAWAFLRWIRIFLAAALLGAAPAGAANIDSYPDPDTEKPCESPTESPQCAAKTFWGCSEQSVATCALMGLEVQADGDQVKDDKSAKADAWLRPWTLSWTELLDVTNHDDLVWEIKGLRPVVPSRLRGSQRSPRSLANTYEMMIRMVRVGGIEERASVFLVQRRGSVWQAVAYARWNGSMSIDDCKPGKYNSLGCRYMVIGLQPW